MKKTGGIALIFCISTLYCLSTLCSALCLAAEFIHDDNEANCSSDPLKEAMNASVSGMMVQSERMKVISQNIANTEVTGSSPEESPYRRKVTYVTNVVKNGVSKPVVKVIAQDMSPLKKRYQPGHPAADAKGYVAYPNVDMVVETVDAKEAQRSFDADLNSLAVSKNMAYRALEIMR